MAIYLDTGNLNEIEKVNCTMKTYNLDIEVENAVISTFIFKNGAQQ